MAMEAELSHSLLASQATLEELDKEIRNPSPLTGDAELKKVLAQYKRLSPARRAGYERIVQLEIPKAIRPRIQRMLLPEHRWDLKPTVVPAKKSDPLLSYLMSTSGVEFFPDVLVAFAKSRTQMRLLRLHSLIEIYHRRHGVYPKSLVQLRAPKETYDPLANKPFRYRQFSNRYSLSSLGVVQTGPLELIHRP